MRFEVLAPDEIEATECNCSICRKAGYLHLIVRQGALPPARGDDKLTTYTLQHRHGEASFLLRMRNKELLRAALQARRLQRECALPRRAARSRVTGIVLFDGQHWEEAMTARVTGRLT